MIHKSSVFPTVLMLSGSLLILAVEGFSFLPKTIDLLRKERIAAVSICSSRLADLRLHMVDPMSLPLDLGIAVISAAAGAASQMPRIQELEREVQDTKAALILAQSDYKDKLEELEDKMFTMDQVYEAQTERFKRQYDTRMKEELERQVAKIKVDFKYSLDIKLEEQKSKMLSEQLEKLAKGGLPKQEELMNLRVHSDRIVKANEQLESALHKSKEELARLQAAADARRAMWWPFK